MEELMNLSNKEKVSCLDKYFPKLFLFYNIILRFQVQWDFSYTSIVNTMILLLYIHIFLSRNPGIPDICNFYPSTILTIFVVTIYSLLMNVVIKWEVEEQEISMIKRYLVLVTPPDYPSDTLYLKTTPDGDNIRYKHSPYFEFPCNTISLVRWFQTNKSLWFQHKVRKRQCEWTPPTKGWPWRTLT